MKTGGFVVCPACGTRNRTSWEFCVRCGESLEGAVASSDAKRGAEAVSPPAEGGADWGAWAGSLLLVAIGVAAFLYIRQANATTSIPETGLLTIPTQPAKPESLAKAPRRPASAGAKDFAEGSRLVREKKYEEALPFLSNAASAEPGNGLYLSTWAEALWETGAKDEALDRYREAGAAAPEYRLSLARALEKAGRSAEAIREMEDFVASNDVSGQIRDELGHMLYRAGKYEKALPLLEAAAASSPGDVLTQQEFAYAAGKAGDHAKEEKVYRGILAKRPDATVARAHLAESLSRQGKKDEALATLREGMGSGKASAVLHSTLGRLLDEQGRTEEALAEYKQAARLGAGSEHARKVAVRIAEIEKTLPAAPVPESEEAP